MKIRKTLYTASLKLFTMILPNGQLLFSGQHIHVGTDTTDLWCALSKEYTAKSMIQKRVTDDNSQNEN